MSDSSSQRGDALSSENCHPVIMLEYNRAALLAPFVSQEILENELKLYLTELGSLLPSEGRGRALRELAKDASRLDSEFSKNIRAKTGCLLDVFIAAAAGIGGYIVLYNSGIHSFAENRLWEISQLRQAIEHGGIETGSFWEVFLNFSKSSGIIVFTISSASLAYTDIALTLSNIPCVSFAPLCEIPLEYLSELSKFASGTGGGVLPLWGSVRNGLSPEELKVLAGFSRGVDSLEKRDWFRKQRKFQTSVIHLLSQFAVQPIIPSLLPSSDVVTLLSEASQAPGRRWVRGLGIFRKYLLNVTDASFQDQGGLGLELAKNPWRVASSVPPASALGLEIGTPLLAVNGISVNDWKAKELVKRLSNRPVVLSFESLSGANPIDPIQALAAEIAQKISTRVNEKRMLNPHKGVPRPAVLKESTIYKKIDKNSGGKIPLSAWALILMFSGDLRVFGRLGLTCKYMLKSFLSGSRTKGSCSWRLLKWFVRNGSMEKLGPRQKKFFIKWLCESNDAHPEDRIAKGFLRSGFDVTKNIEDIRQISDLSILESKSLKNLATLVDSVTPGFFAVSPETAKRFRIEGVAVELLFVYWRLLLEWRFEQSDTINSLLLIEREDSFLWLRIFIVKLLKLTGRLEDITAKALERDFVRISADELKKAYTIRLTRHWSENWSN